MDKIAKFWKAYSEDSVECLLCPHNCIIKKNQFGICRARKNIDNKLYALNYGKTTGIAIDPIEKKPLYHFYPFAKILSLGANSCNFSCKFCQNYTSSQLKCPTEYISPEELLSLCVKHNIAMVAFTYTEPFTWYEYIYDCAVLFKKNNIKVVLVTNGYINREPLLELLPLISAMNIDLKAFSEEFYQNLCGGRLQPVLETIKIAVNYIHLEITTMIIETQNDDLGEMRELISFVKSLNSKMPDEIDIPLHISRYFPRYKLNLPATSEKKIFEFVKLAKQELPFVYPGNVIAKDNLLMLNTYCPHCNSLLIDRVNQVSFLKSNICPNCGQYIYGVF
ncbi:MAG: AmmeMemoRadiSam system radical SAM enzyme [Candidatus Cloacimonetes bacterium]|jgi:pyruvate formate lyase activating enzyme|nr:AmmeMemoRadiSam system radical SAM enzyme [Candidatus Cloacimonadota bacterium]